MVVRHCTASSPHEAGRDEHLQQVPALPAQRADQNRTENSGAHSSSLLWRVIGLVALYVCARMSVTVRGMALIVGRFDLLLHVDTPHARRTHTRKHTNAPARTNLDARHTHTLSLPL
jgi:hypothetical protein